MYWTDLAELRLSDLTHFSISAFQQIFGVGLTPHLWLFHENKNIQSKVSSTLYWSIYLDYFTNIPRFVLQCESLQIAILCWTHGKCQDADFCVNHVRNGRKSAVLEHFNIFLAYISGIFWHIFWNISGISGIFSWHILHLIRNQLAVWRNSFSFSILFVVEARV